jgi:Immune inhibitor A peptidase M6
VGTVRTWPALDDELGRIYTKPYTLRAVGQHIEVWVANDLSFPAGDCRNDQRVVVTDEQARYLADQFDTRMYPRESEAFSVPPSRDGSKADPALAGLDFTGDGDKIVTLVDNVRDANYYAFPENQTYIGGFFYSIFNELVDRNVMTIDAFDWLHRTGAEPPNEPVPGDPCASAPARPFQYEGTFAHEYQHLLEYYVDPDEVSWVNEGISDWAQTLTGYVDPSKPITDIDFDSHVQCFLGNNGIQTPANPNPRDGGPENSLTLWGDQGNGDEILCDYGAAYSFMEYLETHYGEAFMTALHREPGNGLAGLAAVLTARGIDTTPATLIRNWLAAMALDGVIDRGAELFGRGASLLTVPTLDSVINWDTPQAYSTPGAPPNGADYVRLRGAGGAYLTARSLRRLQFDGGEVFRPLPVKWAVDPSPPDHAGDPALYSGRGDNFDRSIIREVTVPASDPTLTFETRYDTEPGFDSGFVQVSTDGGRTYTSLGNADTTSELDPGADDLLTDNLPGFNGDSGGWRAETFDLSAFAGRTILLSFRYVTDVNTGGAGWWIDDVAVGGTTLTDGTAVSGWRTATQIRPVRTGGFDVQFLGYTSKTLTTPGRNGRDVAFVRRIPTGDGKAFDLDRKAIRRLTRGARDSDVVAVLVMQRDPDEAITQYAPYTLKVNGVRQPGG